MAKTLDEEMAARNEKTLPKKKRNITLKTEEPMVSRKKGLSANMKAAQFIKKMNSREDASLDKVAIDKGYRTYTYRQMFRRWERYAQVFSGLEITEENHSRVGMLCSRSEEALSIMYGLNSMGVSISLLDTIHLGSDRFLKKTVEAEMITDLVILDDSLLPPVVEIIRKNAHHLGLKHIIVGKTKYAQDLEDPQMRIMINFMRKLLLADGGVYDLSDLLKKYEAYPIQYGSGKNDETAFIVHTSGTTKGVSKPVPLSDKAINTAALSVMRAEGYKDMIGKSVMLNSFGPSTAYALADTIHFSFVSGGRMVISSFMDNRKYKVMKEKEVNIFFYYYAMINELKVLPKEHNRDLFSGLKLLVLGGEYVSCSMAKSLRKHMKLLGFKGKIAVGYGLSECAGAVLLNNDPEKAEGISTALPGIDLLIYDEDKKEYFSIDGEPCRGGLYIHSDSLSKGKIDQNEFFKLVTINRKKYYCTYDAFESDGKGNLRFIGRMNRYFVNNEGIRFDSALIETQMSKKKDIEACAVAPRFSRVLHDTIPVLYVQGRNVHKADIRKDLKECFIKDDLFKKTNLPAYVVLTDDLPRNRSGKADVYKIISEGLDGRRFVVEPIIKNDKLMDILLKVPMGINPFADDLLNVPDEISRNFKEQVEGMKPFAGKARGNKVKNEDGKKKEHSSQNFPLFEWLNGPDEVKAFIEMIHEFLLMQIEDYQKADGYGFIPYLLYNDKTKKVIKMFERLTWEK